MVTHIPRIKREARYTAVWAHSLFSYMCIFNYVLSSKDLFSW